EDGIRDFHVTGVQTCALPIYKDYVSRTELAILDILVHNNWERPIYFARTVPSDNYIGLDNYLVSEGFTYRLVPIQAATEENIERSEERRVGKERKKGLTAEAK